MFRPPAAAAAVAAAVLAAAAPAQQTAPAAPVVAAATLDGVAPRIAAFFDEHMARQHIPGLVYGLVIDGRLVLVRGAGIADVASRRPVTADSAFRIASMSKAFTALAILKLRDQGKLALEAPADTYVPEMRGWRYPTSDSPKIRVRDLLHHTAGYVEDNPWGDRQQPLSEAEFTAMLRNGVPFAGTPGVGMEYSNFGYATLGRIVSNVGGVRYQDWIGRNLLAPLGMRATGFDVLASPQGSRALGYRWQDDAWLREPDMADGAFGAMGGLQTTANDYWRWVAFLLSAWPARDGAETGPVSRATVREIVEGANHVAGRMRPAALGEPCRQAVAYAMGWSEVDDCDLGRIVTHTGGYPGYGSVVMLLPDAGVGMFAFANRTYAAPSVPTFRSLVALRQAGLAPIRHVAVSPGLEQAYRQARQAWQAGDPSRAPLAVNVALDRDLARRRADWAQLRAEVGTCPGDEPITPVSAMEGTFIWTCETGRIAGRVQRAPTPALSLQVIEFRVAPR